MKWAARSCARITSNVSRRWAGSTSGATFTAHPPNTLGIRCRAGDARPADFAWTMPLPHPALCRALWAAGTRTWSASRRYPTTQCRLLPIAGDVSHELRAAGRLQELDHLVRRTEFIQQPAVQFGLYFHPPLPFAHIGSQIYRPPYRGKHSQEQ